MELAGHKCLGFCEFNKYATASYTSMHLITDEQRNELLEIPMKKRLKEINQEVYRNGEWYSNDIRTVETRCMPRADCWCFGFPCQDISIAGKQLGFYGRRSSLFFTVTGLIENLEEKDRPSILFIENVKNLLSINGGFDFARVLVELDKIGYDAEWCILNSKDFGVPHHRERVFIIGHLRGRCSSEVFPLRQTITKTRIEVVGKLQGKRRQRNDILSVNGLSTCLDTMQGGNHEPKIMITTAKGTEVRKVTPRECFRLQGWTDEYFDRAAMVNSDSQLYKQAGNGVTVNVIQAIAERFN